MGTGGYSKRSRRDFPAANGSRSEHEPWTSRPLPSSSAKRSSHHDHYEKTHPKHNWWNWDAPYLSARQNGSRLTRQQPPVATWRRFFIFFPDDAR